jgi:lysophospholipase L1-like esterase
MALRLPRHLTLIGISLIVVALVLAAMNLLAAPPRAHAAAYLVGPKHYYLGLGDSLAFGYQPDLDWTHGYVQDLYNGNLSKHGSGSLTDYGCNGETSTTMINGGCPYWYALHNYYLGPQLTAAVNFLHSHAGQVSPVTLDMGANDLLPDINSSTCTVSSKWTTDLATLNSNLNNVILPDLVNALKNSSGQRTGDLVMMNYYDPYSKQCPNSLTYVQQLNTAIANDAATFGIPVVNTYAAFGGSNQANNICNLTWICSIFHDVHPQDSGYQTIANAFGSTLGY